MSGILDVVFNEAYWFPPGTDFRSVLASGMKVPQMVHLAHAVVLAVLLTVVRVLLNEVLFRPLAARHLPKYADAVAELPDQSPVLEAAFSKGTTRVDGQAAKRLARESGIEESRVRDWFRVRRRRQRGQKAVNKWLESSWRFTYYSFALAFGAYVLRGKDWFWSHEARWEGYPYHEVPDDMRYYYLMSLAIYVQFVFTQFIEERKKDFWEMLTHHVATIVLLLFSYYVNFCRIGVLVLFVHDCSDPILEFAKLINYARYQRLCDALFVAFALTFGVTRLYIYPRYVLLSAYQSKDIVGEFTSWKVFIAFLFLLQLLHLYWFYIIVKMALSFGSNGKIAKDGRSQTEDDSDHHKKE